MLPHASISSRRLVPSLVVLALLAVATTVTAANDVDAMVDEIYREQNIQRQLAITAPDESDEPGERPSRGVGIPLVFGWLVLAGVAVGAMALMVWLMAVDQDAAPASRFKRRRRKRRAGKRLDDAASTAATQVSSDWLATADNLARQGRFAEAIHRLLLGVLDTLSTANGRTSDAKTAREIVRTHVGPRPERLRMLAQASELVHFGGRAATQRQFENCRRDAVDIDQAASPAPRKRSP